MSPPVNKAQKFAGTCTLPPFAAEPALPPCEPPPHAAVTTAAATIAAHVQHRTEPRLWSAIVVFAFIEYLLNRAATLRAELSGDQGSQGNQNNANCSPARAASTKSSTPVPLTTVSTQSMNFASETTGTPNSRAR